MDFHSLETDTRSKGGYSCLVGGVFLLLSGRGDLLYTSYANKKTEKQTSNETSIFGDEFHALFTLLHIFFALPVYYLSDGFKARLKSF